MEGCFVAQVVTHAAKQELVATLISQSNHFFPVKHSPPQLSQSSSREHLTQQEEALLIKLVVLLLHLQYLPVPKWWVQKSVIGVGIPAQMVSPLRGF
ncbi:hypothetical protein OIU85_011226 [Salix viminalis]|uniref:Uncharacterized protein n=1 Tax=Salix viminalis TaxID=40686 RepID=A0A9Q0NSB7_SALVM|nr:hypothetical protein OIU85_011226 [Salix viminalis]